MPSSIFANYYLKICNFDPLSRVQSSTIQTPEFCWLTLGISAQLILDLVITKPELLQVLEM